MTEFGREISHAVKLGFENGTISFMNSALKSYIEEQQPIGQRTIQRLFQYLPSSVTAIDIGRKIIHRPDSNHDTSLIVFTLSDIDAFFYNLERTRGEPFPWKPLSLNRQQSHS